MISVLLIEYCLPFFIAGNHNSPSSHIIPNYETIRFYIADSLCLLSLPVPLFCISLVKPWFLSQTHCAASWGLVKQNCPPPSPWSQAHTSQSWDSPHPPTSAPSALSKGQVTEAPEEKSGEDHPAHVVSFIAKWRNIIRKPIKGSCCFAHGTTPRRRWRLFSSDVARRPARLRPLPPQGPQPTGFGAPGGVGGGAPWLSSLLSHGSLPLSHCLRAAVRHTTDMCPQKIASIWGILACEFLLHVLRAVPEFVYCVLLKTIQHSFSG